MERLEPTVIEPLPARPDDERVGSLLARNAQETARVALLGFPCDAGVTRNGGRQGAAAAPDRIRHWLYRLTPPAEEPAFAELLADTIDLGNVCCGDSLEDDQATLGSVIAELLRDERGIVPIVLGGGHETTFGHFLGYAESKSVVDIVNLDAHADVRPLVDGLGHSGSPFRQAIEHQSSCCRRYAVAGLTPWSTSPDHVTWVREHGGVAHWSDEVTSDLVRRLYSSDEASILASFDMDAVDVAQAPGVSAPNTCGLDRSVWLDAAYQAGRSPAVRSMDLVEVCPPHDVDEHTARLAALTIWSFLRGVAERGRWSSWLDRPPVPGVDSPRRHGPWHT